jgi:hypothetical protein
MSDRTPWKVIPGTYADMFSQALQRIAELEQDRYNALYEASVLKFELDNLKRKLEAGDAEA